jgi:hypothetical protein
MNLAKKSIISVFNYCFVCYLASDLSADIGLRQIILPSQLDALYSFFKQLFCRLVVNFFLNVTLKVIRYGMVYEMVKMSKW